MVYFVQPIDGGPIKIGFSGDVPGRIQQLEAHYGCRLAILATMEGGREEEKAIHERFSHLRFGRTEQFRPGPELLAFIGRPLFAAAGDVVEIKPAGTGRVDTEGWQSKPPIVQFRGTAEFKAWLLEAMEADRSKSLADFLERAAVMYAKQIGFMKPPPRR